MKHLLNRRITEKRVYPAIDINRSGTLLSLMSIGNLIAGFLVGVLPGALGMKRSVLLLTIGYAVGYSLMGLTGAVAVLALAFFLVGIAKGSVMNTCTILVSDNSASVCATSCASSPSCASSSTTRSTISTTSTSC